MKIASGILSAAALALALTVSPPAAQACNGGGSCENAPGHTKGAPGPIAGACAEMHTWAEQQAPACGRMDSAIVRTMGSCVRTMGFPRCRTGCSQSQ